MIIKKERKLRSKLESMAYKIATNNYGYFKDILINSYEYININDLPIIINSYVNVLKLHNRDLIILTEYYFKRLLLNDKSLEGFIR